MSRAACWTTMILLLSLTACVNRSVNTELTSCTYPDSPRTPAPDFICDGNVPGFPVTALKSVDESELSVSERMDHALKQQIQQWSLTWSQEWFSVVEQQYTALEYLQRELTEKARVVRSRMSPKNQLWLLIGVPTTIEVLQNNVHAAVATAP